MKINDNDFSKMFIEMYADIKAMRSEFDEIKKVNKANCEEIEKIKGFKNKMLAIGSGLAVISGVVADWIRSKFF